MRHGDNNAWLTCLAFFEGACAYCGATGVKLTVDHLEPVGKGGKSTVDNMVPACAKCNEDKANYEWRDWMMRRDDFSQARMNKIFDWRRIGRQSGL